MPLKVSRIIFKTSKHPWTKTI